MDKLKDNPYYKLAMDYLAKNDLSQFPNGKHVIDEGNVWVNVVEAPMHPLSEAVMEVHDEFIDVHIPFSAPETYGTKPRTECTSPKGEMDKANDYLLYEDKPTEVFTAQPGQQTIFCPDMAHAPLIGEGTLKKAIFKIRVK